MRLLGTNLVERAQTAAEPLKEAFQQLWDYNSPAWAGQFLDARWRQTIRSRIEISSGVVEGRHNKAKVTMRKSCSFRTCRVLAMVLDHSMGKLPEPESTHDFF